MTTVHPTACPTCHGEGKILAIWERPNSPPGNGYVGCPDCAKGAAYNATLQRELTQFGSNQR